MPMARHEMPLKAALKVGVFYLVLGALWIVFTDRVVSLLTADLQLAGRIQTLKGIAFVVGSALVVGVLVYRELVLRREREEHYGTLVEQSLVGIYVIRKERFAFVNDRFGEVFGYSPEEIVTSLTVDDLVALEDRARVRENLAQREEGEVEALHYRFTGLRSDGSTLRAEVHGRRIVWEGEPAVLGVLLDVTEEEQLQEQLRRSQRMEEMGRLTGMVAHDFRNLLGAITASLEICQDEIAPDHPARIEVSEARETAERAAALCRQLLAFSGQRLTTARPMDLSELVEECLPMLSRLTGPGVRLEAALADDLPAIRVDPRHFEQILVNLVLNASQAVEGRGRIVLRTGRDSNGGRGRGVGEDPPSVGHVFLDVEDDGRGIDPEARKRIFEPFFTTRETGTGLGLSTVHGIVRQAGGEIEVDSEVDVGTTFRVLLPAVDEAPRPVEEVRASAPSDEAPPPSEAVAGVRILLVEDEPALRRVTVKALERFGYEVRAAGTAEEALGAAREEGERIGLVLTDVGLPDKNGVELAEELRTILGDVPVLFTSGHSDAAVMDRLARDPSGCFLEKPYSIDELVRTVTASIEREQDPPGDTEEEAGPP